MPNGDKAAALGWTTYAPTQDRRLGYDNDNYVLDRVAEQFATLRDKVLPAISQPIFSVQRSTSFSGAIAPQSDWYFLPAAAWAAPRLNSGFTSWKNSELTVKLAGVYDIRAHVQFPDDKHYEKSAIIVVKNTTQIGDANTVVHDGPATAASATAVGLAPLVAGDVLRVAVRQQNTDKWDLAIDPVAFKLTFSAEWVRA